MELKFIMARTLPSLQRLMEELTLRLVLIPQFHPPIYDGANWVITWYSPVNTDEVVERAINGE